MKTTLLMAAIAAGLTLAATAEAREGRGPRMELPAFEQLDANADGGITLQEVMTQMETARADRFAQMDTNGDGGLSAEEMTANAQTERAERMANRIADRIEKADTNGDGLLQADEITEARGDRRGPNPERMFERVDANDDGMVDAEEYAEMAERMQNRGDRGRRGDN